MNNQPTLSQLRQRLDDLAIPGATPGPGEISQLRQLWEGTYKPHTQASYHPIIEDRLALAETYAQQSKQSHGNY